MSVSEKLWAVLDEIAEKAKHVKGCEELRLFIQEKMRDTTRKTYKKQRARQLLSIIEAKKTIKSSELLKIMHTDYKDLGLTSTMQAALLNHYIKKGIIRRIGYGVYQQRKGYHA